MNHTGENMDEEGNLENDTDLHYLDPERLEFHGNGAGLRLRTEDGTLHADVSLIRMFPLSEPNRYFSIRDAEGREIGILVNPECLGSESRRVITDVLNRRYLVPAIRRILSARDRFGSVEWTVETDRGMRTFSTHDLHENIHQPAPGRYLVTDTDGNRYDIRDLSTLDDASRSCFLRHL